MVDFMTNYNDKNSFTDKKKSFQIHKKGEKKDENQSPGLGYAQH